MGLVLTMLLLVPNGLFGRQLGADQPSCGWTCLGCLSTDHRETGVTLGFRPTTTSMQGVSVVLWSGGWMVALLGGVCWGLAMSWPVTTMVVRAGMVWWMGG